MKYLWSILSGGIMKTKIRLIKLKKWFPEDDEVAICIARLCILREDLHLDFKGEMEKSFTSLDENGPAWRKTYFFRNYVKTLREIIGLLHRLQLNSNFMDEFLSSTKDKDEFMEQLAQLNAIHAKVKDFRNSVCAHVSHGAIQKAIASLTYDDSGFFEKRSDGELHLKFAGDLVFFALFSSVPRGQQMEEAEKILSRIIPKTPLLLIDKIIMKYIELRGLIG
jgi:hypothetical protein